jgi:hypothetical protein
MSECLHCDIGELIAERTSHGPKPVDLAEIGSMIAQALGEFILAAPQHEQAKPDGRMPRDAFADVSGYPDESERPHRSHYRLLTFAFRGVFRRALRCAGIRRHTACSGRCRRPFRPRVFSCQER